MPPPEPSRLLDSRLPMRAADSVAAIIVVDARRYFLQLRDNKPEIYYPGHWGLFGGAVEPGEDDLATLRRELDEELGIRPRHLAYFSEFEFDLAPIGEKRIYRRYYEAAVSAADIAGAVLTEGSAMAAFPFAEAFAQRVTPYDSFALWLHYMRMRG